MGRTLNIDWQHSTQQLRELYLSETDHQNRTRLHAIWLVRKGRPMAEVAEIIGFCYESVRRWMQGYRSGGLEKVRALRHGGSGGRTSRLSEEQQNQLIEHAEGGELRTISDGVRWAREEAGVEYTYWGMRHVFERLDLKKKVPRQQSPKADPEEQEAWKKGG